MPRVWQASKATSKIATRDFYSIIKWHYFVVACMDCNVKEMRLIEEEKELKPTTPLNCYKRCCIGNLSGMLKV